MLIAASLPAPQGRGQDLPPTGNLYGTVVDVQENVMVGVAATLTGPGAPLITRTDGRGDFHFLNLSPADYSIALDQQGFERALRTVTVLPGRNAVIQVHLSVAGASETVIVGGPVPALDTRKVQSGATFGQKELQQIPTTRDPWAVLRQVPGVLLETVNVGGDPEARQPGFVGKGSHTDQNSYNLDGVAISLGGVSPLFFDFDSLESIDVATGGSDPALAVPGVTLNLVTKRGTNEFRGSARTFYTGGAGWDYGIEAGGPLWKDRVWAWGAGARNAYLGQTFVSAGEPIQSQETLKHWNAKLNASPSSANAFTFSYTNFDRFRTGQGFPGVTLESSLNNDHPGRSYRVEDSQVVSSVLFLSGYLSDVTATSTYTPEGGLDEQALLDHDVWRRSYQTRRVLDAKRQAGLNASAFFDTGDLRHEVKFGLGLSSPTSWPGDQLVGELRPRPAEDLADITRAQNAKTDVKIYGTFVGDTIQTGHLTVNVGVRFDYQQSRNVPSAVAANPVFPELLPAVQYPGDSGYPVTWRLFQPRIGATYAVDGSRTLLRASYARFSNQLDSFTVAAVSAAPGVAVLGYLWYDTNADRRVQPNEIDFASGLKEWDGVDPYHPGSTEVRNRISPSLRPPMTDEVIVGVERQLSSDLSASLSYTYRTSRDMVFAKLIGTSVSSYRFVGNASGTVIDHDGFALSFSEPYYSLTECPVPCGGYLVENRPDARETYGGVEIQVLKSYSHGWMARASFSYNDWRQRIGPGGIVNPNNEIFGSNANGAAVDGAINAMWQFNVGGSVELPLGIAVGANLFGRQGFPTYYFVEVAAPNDLSGGDYLLQIGQVTAYRTPDVYQLDLQLSRSFRIGSVLTVTPQFACFNALDSRTVLSRDGGVGRYDVQGSPAFSPNDRFNEVVETLSPRVFRGGVRIEF